jgi:HD-GYP domain-containing protein (c-di-GMP phosphodiesterase class II)
MTEKPKRQMIAVDRLCVGLHIRLASWLGHPFLTSSFKIKNQQQIDVLRSMGLSEIEYLQGKSDAEPLAAPQAAAIASERSTIDALMAEKKSRIATLTRERERIQVAEKKYVKTAAAINNVMRTAGNNPAQAVQNADQISSDLAEIFLAGDEPYVHLMGDHVVDDSAQYHSLNVTVLALIIARALGIKDPKILRAVAQGAMLHDVGKVMIPTQVLLKEEEFTHAEATLFKLHPGYGIKLLQTIEDIPRQVREVILFHHECLDGSGYPKGLRGENIPVAVRIVSIANAYDNLCNERIAARSKTPAEALSYMYKHELAKYDKDKLSALIKALGVYPPGTVVVLKSGRVGMVMSVDQANLLHPNLMLYDPTIPKDAAPVVNLSSDLGDAITRTLRPSALPSSVHDYLSPRKKIAYFVDQAG